MNLSAKVSKHRKDAEKVSKSLEKVRKEKDKKIKKKISKKEREWLKRYNKSLKKGKPMKFKGGKKEKKKKDKEILKMFRNYEMYLNFEVAQYIPIWKDPKVEPQTCEDYHPEFIFIVDEMETLRKRREHDKYEKKFKKYQDQANERYSKKVEKKIKNYDLDFDDVDSVCKFLDKVEKWRKDDNQHKRLKKMGFKFGTSGLYISAERLVTNLEKRLKNVKKTDKKIRHWMEINRDTLPDNVRLQLKKMSDKMVTKVQDAYTDIHHFKCTVGSDDKKVRKHTVDLMNKLGIPAKGYDLIDLDDE